MSNPLRYFLGMALLAIAAVLASWAIYDHKAYLVPIDCYTFALAMFTMVRSSQ